MSPGKEPFPQTWLVEEVMGFSGISEEDMIASI